LSESLNDQFHVNQYISKLIVRLANFGYPGNVPKVATTIDRKKLQAFFSGKPAFIGMSSLDYHKSNEQVIATMVNQALSVRRDQDADGLSIEIPPTGEKDLFSKVTRVMIVIGLTPQYKREEDIADIVNIVKHKVAERLGTDLRELDFCAYSYTSPNVELTIFLRHDTYRSNFLLNHFLNAYLKWHNGEKTEFEYLTQKISQGADNDFLEDVFMALKQEVGDNNLDWLKLNSTPKIKGIE
jgi:hypothetical protein